MSEQQPVRFIRKNGRIIPVRGKKAITGHDKDQLARKADILSILGKRDKKLSDQGNTVAKFSAAAGIVSGAASFTKTVARKAPILKVGMRVGAVALGAFALLNRGFANGRAMSSKDYGDYSKQLASGKTSIKRANSMPTGATERAYNTAKLLSDKRVIAFKRRSDGFAY